MATKYYIGTSGWHYEHWRGDFYPRDLPKTRWLEFYARQFNTVELNNSFYRLPTENAFANWENATPSDFIFAVKVSRFITHIKRLKDTSEALEKFLSRARLLGNKLGPLLYQLPSNMKNDAVRLEDFLKILPDGLRHVFEFRHDSWFDDKTYALLRRYGAGLCLYDMPDFTTPVLATANFAYVRFHGSRALYSSGYTDRELESWAENIKKLKISTVYVYFNNDAGGFAVPNAQMLRGLLE